MDALHVISFPKSGRTWLRVMLDDIGLQAKYSHDGSDHILRCKIVDLNPDKSRYSRLTILLMVRDPRDTVVSGYFQVTRRLKIEGNFLSEFIRDDRHGIEKICRFNLHWFSAAHQINRFAILSYEDMHRSTKAALGAVAAFAGTIVNDKAAEVVVTRRTFERMQAAEASGELAKRYGEILRPGDRGDIESFKVRRGLVGGYRDYLSEADLSYCDAVLARTDYWSRCSEATSRWGVAKSIEQMPAAIKLLRSGISYDKGNH